MITQSQISKLSNRLLSEQGGRRVPESVLERDYCIAWFLVGLARTSLRAKLAFKGGTALKRCYFVDYRFSEDLDFTLLEAVSSFEELKSSLEHIYSTVKRDSNITLRFSRQDSQSHQNSYTFYVAYEGPLPTASQLKEIKVDVTIKEKMVEPPQQRPVLSYAEYSDLPIDASVPAYSLMEIATEKTVALLDRARTEPRDLYDLWFLAEHERKIDLGDCVAGIQAKLEHRGKSLEAVRGEFDTKETRLSRTWESRLSPQMSNLPEFEGVYRAVKRKLRQARITTGDL
jgi:predicted nucleotidyltransferase component of viral defense system